MLSLTRQEPWFANFLLSEARNYRSRGIREIQAGAWAVGTVFDSAGNVVTPATIGDARWVLMAPFWDEQRAPALLMMRDGEVNDSYIQYGILNRGALNDALLENSRLIVRPGPFMAGLEAKDVTVSPPVRGLGDVQSVLEYFDQDMLTAAGATMTGALHVIEVDDTAPRSQAVNRGYVDALVLGVANFIGRLDAENDEVYYTQISGITPSPGPLCAPDVARNGGMVLCEKPGIMPAGSQMEGTVFNYGDRALSDGATWYHFPSVTEQVTGTMVALTPTVFGQDNAQMALQVTEAQVNNKLSKTSDTMNGTLTIDPGVPGLPALYIRQPVDDTGQALHIVGNPNGTAMRIDGSLDMPNGNITLGYGTLNAMAGYVMSRQYFVGVDLNCGYLLGPDAQSGGLWRNTNGQMSLRRPPGQNDIYSEDNNAVTRFRILDERDARALPALIPVTPKLIDPPAWTEIWSGNYSIPRGGNSLVALNLSLDVDVDNPSGNGLVIAGARCLGLNEQHVWLYKLTALSTGINLVLYAGVSGTNPTLNVELASLESQPVGVRLLVNPASMIMITDLGPQ